MVSQVAQTVKNIGTSSQGITDTIGVIYGTTFQSTILAPEPPWKRPGQAIQKFESKPL